MRSAPSIAAWPYASARQKPSPRQHASWRSSSTARSRTSCSARTKPRSTMTVGTAPGSSAAFASARGPSVCSSSIPPRETYSGAKFLRRCWVQSPGRCTRSWKRRRSAKPRRTRSAERSRTRPWSAGLVCPLDGERLIGVGRQEALDRSFEEPHFLSAIAAFAAGPIRFAAADDGYPTPSRRAARPAARAPPSRRSRRRPSMTAIAVSASVRR